MGSISTFISLAFPYFASTALPFTKPEFYVWAVCAGFNVAMVFAFVLKSVESKFVIALFENEAFDRDSAITITQAKVKCGALLKFILREKSTLRNVILLVDSSKDNIDNNGDDGCSGDNNGDNGCSGDNNGDNGCSGDNNGDNGCSGDDGSKAKLDFESARFYINQEKLDRASSLKKGAVKWYLLPVFCAVSIGLAIGVCYLMPIFLNW